MSTEQVMGNPITTAYCTMYLNPTATTTIVVEGTVTAVSGRTKPNFIAPVIIVERSSNDDLDHLYDLPEALSPSSSFLSLARETHPASHGDPEVDRGHLLLILLALLVLILLLLSVFILWKGRLERNRNSSSGQEELGVEPSGTENSDTIVELDSAQIMELESAHISRACEMAEVSIVELDAEPSREIVDWEHRMAEPSGLVTLAVP